MPLAAQALLPFVALLVAALIVRWRPRRRINGWIAGGATGIAGIIALVELLRLAPGEHVDVPYLTTFPYADLAVRLDGLSLAYATTTLITAAALMVTRQLVRGDRRDPWFGWLLTSAAACAVILADNLLLLFIALQLLTLAWSGALDETARRRRGLRLTVQIADIGLLLAAASAIQSVGTSAFSGVPSDTFGLATFLLMLLPVAVRVGALAWASSGPPAAVTFEPAVAWVAPAGYLLLRLLALMGGRLPDRTTAVAMFGGGVLVAIGFATLALGRPAGLRLAAPLLAAQAALAIALSAGSEPLMTAASTWLWLLLIPLAGLVSVRAPGPRCWVPLRPGSCWASPAGGSAIGYPCDAPAASSVGGSAGRRGHRFGRRRSPPGVDTYSGARSWWWWRSRWRGRDRLLPLRPLRCRVADRVWQRRSPTPGGNDRHGGCGQLVARAAGRSRLGDVGHRSDHRNRVVAPRRSARPVQF